MRRYGVALRGGTLVAAWAAHDVLAKSLYAAGPPGTAIQAADQVLELCRRQFRGMVGNATPSNSGYPPPSSSGPKLPAGIVIAWLQEV